MSEITLLAIRINRLVVTIAAVVFVYLSFAVDIVMAVVIINTIIGMVVAGSCGCGLHATWLKDKKMTNHDPGDSQDDGKDQEDVATADDSAAGACHCCGIP